MRKNLTVSEVILLAYELENLTPTGIGEYRKAEGLQRLLQTPVTYNKETGVTTLHVGDPAYYTTYYNDGILCAMDNYKAAIAYAVMLEFSDNVNPLEEGEWKFSNILTELLGYDYRHLNGRYGEVYVKEDNGGHFIKIVSCSNTVKSVEQFLIDMLK